MKKLIFLAIMSFAVFVLIKAPASLLLPYINKSPHFQVQNITGNLFAGQLQTNGKIDNLSYQINAWQLLLANLVADVRITEAENFIHGTIKIDLITKKIELGQLTGQLNLQLLQQYIAELSTVEPQGQLSFNKLKLSWDDMPSNPIPQQLFGSIDLSKLNLLGQDFGDYQLNIESKLPNIIATLNSKKSATTDTKIKLNLLDKKKQLSISGKISGKNANVSAILQQLNITNIERIIRY